jgi:hypothetical protein
MLDHVRLVIQRSRVGANDCFNRGCLQSLQQEFGDSVVKIDTSVGNAARITKLFGTRACKGDDVPDRPHRMARLIDVPAQLQAVPDLLLCDLAAGAPSANTAAHPAVRQPTAPGRFDLEAWIAAHLPCTKSPKSADGCTVWVIPKCPWNPDHVDSAFIKRWPDGKIGAGCHHNSCSKFGWHEMRDAVEPGWRDRRTASPFAKPSARPVTPPAPRITLAAYRPFPLEVLPSVLQTYIQAVSSATASDVAFAALPALTVCAAAIGNSRRLQGANKSAWQVPAILWTACVGESGSGKSPPLALCLRPIKDREAKYHQTHQSQLANYERSVVQYEKLVADWKRARDEDSEPPDKPGPPRAERCLVSDTTIEALAPLLHENPRGLLLARDELAGWFGSFDRYAGRGRASADAAQWLSVFDGDSIFVDRKSGAQRYFVPHATVSVCGGIQPGILRRALCAEHRENGLAARILFAYPPRKPKRWSDADVSPEVEQSFATLLDRLYALEGRRDELGAWRPVMLGMTAAAKDRYVDYFNAHNAVGVAFDGDMSAAWTKLEGYALRLALVIHLVRVVSGGGEVAPHEVDQQSMEAGIELCRWFAHEAKRIYGMLDESPAEQEARQLVELIERRGGGVTVRELQHASRRYRGNASDAEAALNMLVAAELGSWALVPPGPTGGRATREFRLQGHGNGNGTLLNPEESTSSVTVTAYDTSELSRANAPPETDVTRGAAPIPFGCHRLDHFFRGHRLCRLREYFCRGVDGAHFVVGLALLRLGDGLARPLGGRLLGCSCLGVLFRGHGRSRKLAVCNAVRRCSTDPRHTRHHQPCTRQNSKCCANELAEISEYPASLLESFSLAVVRQRHETRYWRG